MTAVAPKSSLIARLFRGPAPIYLGAMILARLGSMVLIPMYTRRLTTAEYANFALAQTVISFLPVVFTLGLISALPKFYFMEEDREVGRTNAGAVALWLAAFDAIFCTVAISGIFAVFGSRGRDFQYLLACITIAGAGSALATVPDIFFRSAQKPFLAVSYQLTQFLLQVGLGLLLVLHFGRGLRGAVEAMAISYAAAAVMSVGFVLWYLRGRLDRAMLKRALPFALPFIPHFLANWVLLSADRWVMKFFHLETTLGPYVLATQLTSPITMLIVAWNDTESARMGEIYRTGGLASVHTAAPRIRRNYVLVTLIPSLGIIAGIPLLSALIGGRFAAAIPLIPVMAAISVVESMQIPNSNILYYASRTRTIAATTSGAAVLNIGLNFALVPFFGSTGALVARFSTGAIRSLAMWRLADRCR